MTTNNHVADDLKRHAAHYATCGERAIAADIYELALLTARAAPDEITPLLPLIAHLLTYCAAMTTDGGIQ